LFASTQSSDDSELRFAQTIILHVIERSISASLASFQVGYTRIALCTRQPTFLTHKEAHTAIRTDNIRAAANFFLNFTTPLREIGGKSGKSGTDTVFAPLQLLPLRQSMPTQTTLLELALAFRFILVATPMSGDKLGTDTISATFWVARGATEAAE
jgi:hypothetical protein